MQPRIQKNTMLKKMWNQNGWPRPPTVDEIKIFDNDDQATKYNCYLLEVILAGHNSILWPGHYYQKFIPSTAGGLGCPFWFHIFSAWRFLGSWPQLFLHQGILVGIKIRYSSNATSHSLTSCYRVNAFSRLSVEAYNTSSSYHSNWQ